MNGGVAACNRSVWVRLWVDSGDFRQSEAQFRYQAISGTYSVPIFSRD